mgnify:CR=1 FL=1
MNERIKELMLEAGYAAPELALRGQKLAELIVQECVGIIAKRKDEAIWNVDEAMTMAEIDIEEHFGVE